MISSTDLDTGDLLLFTSTSLFGRLIEFFGKSKYSHVAIVLKDPTYINPSMHGLFVLESGYEGVRDYEDHTVKFGVQINRLENVLHNYNNIYVRKLDCSRNEVFYNSLKDINKNIHGKPYDLIVKDWMEAKVLVDTESISYVEKLFADNNVHKTSTFWCSSLVAYIYNKLGLIGDIPWSIISPKEFSTTGKLINFINCKLGPELLLKMSLV